MSAIRYASATGVAALALLAGCERVAGPVVVAAPASAPVATLDTVLAADTAPRALAGGGYGGSIRPTGMTANGITP